MKWMLLFLMISLGVTVGNLSSSYIQWRVVQHVLEQEAQAAEKAMNERKKRMAEESARASERARERREQQRIRAEKEREVQRKRRETCVFWRNQYRETGNEMDKIHRDNSCRDAGM